MCSLDLNSLPEPSFVERDAAAVTAEMVAMFEAMTGRTLYPAQPERVEIDLVAYREMLVRIGIQALGVAATRLAFDPVAPTVVRRR